MKKMKLMSALLALMLLLSAAMPSLAMTDAEWVWYLLRDYGGSNGKNGCYLNSNTFVAVQVDEESPITARLIASLKIQKWGDEIIFGLFAHIENGNTSEVLTEYEIEEVTLTVDGKKFYWTDLISNNDDAIIYTTVPGVVSLMPEVAVYKALMNATHVSITAKAYSYRRGWTTFTIDDYDQCANFKEFSKLVCNYDLYSFADLGFMNAVALVFPMRMESSSGGHYYGETLYVINCNSSISLRTRPSPDADRILMIPKGESVTYLENAGNGFYKINYDGWTGYASSIYLGR